MPVNPVRAAEQLLAAEEEKRKSIGLEAHPEFTAATRKIALELTDKLADKKPNKLIVELGALLSDVGIARTLLEKRPPQDHIPIGVKMAEELMKPFNLSAHLKRVVIACIEGHHGDKSKLQEEHIEVEIVKNADNLRFLQPAGFLKFLHFAFRLRGFEGGMKFAREKLEEKRGLISLDIVKEEAMRNYKAIDSFLRVAGF